MSTIEVKKEFKEFGKNIQIVAICTVLTIVTGMTGLIALIFTFIALGNIKRINLQLNNFSLEEFRSNYIRGFIYGVVGMIILGSGGVSIAFYFIFMPFSFPLWSMLSITFTLLSAGLIILIAGLVVEIKAWKNLKVFFEDNSNLFPSDLSSELIDGCDKIKKGTLLSAFWFLVIPAIIGFIFQVIGFFKLAKLDTLSTFDAPKKPESVEQADIPKPVSHPETFINFCPNCGAKSSGIGKFCALCGSEVN